MIYDYECPSCGQFEVEQKISDKPLKECPACKKEVKRLISLGHFVLKGDNWEKKNGY